MTLSWIIFYIPQLVKMVKTKSVNDISLAMIYLTLVGYFFGMIYMFGQGFGLWWFINYVNGITNCALLLYFYYKYKK